MPSSPHQVEGIRVVLVDIEGTTSPTAVVHETLFGDARRQLPEWLPRHATDPEIAVALETVRTEAGLPADAPLADVVAVLTSWIDEDRKATPLKTIQGGIWADGLATGRLGSELFADVAPAVVAWHEAGAHLAVFSSGSVAVQRPWFAGAGLGDRFGDFFDTANAGPKQEPASYLAVAAALVRRHGCAPDEVVFLSDVPAELDAASAAGLRTVGVTRPGEPYGDADFGAHPTIGSFADLAVGVRPEPTAEDARNAGDLLAAEAARLTALGWMRATAGNLSVVLRREPLRLAVTASGVDKGELTGADVVVVDDHGAPVPTDGLAPRRPTAEAELHSIIAATTGAGSVVHVHALAAVVAGERWPDGVPLERIEMVKSFGHDAEATAVVPVIENSQSMAELGERFRAVYDASVPAVIVARHGMYVWGRDLRQARHHVEGLEWALSFAVATAGPHPSTGDPDTGHAVLG